MLFRRLPRPIPGVGAHRSGWPYAMRSLRRLCGPHGRVLLDDYVERTFHFATVSEHVPHSSPWVAICHHPPEAPAWFPTTDLRRVIATPAFIESLADLRLVIALAPHVAEWMRGTLKVEAVSVGHPSARSRLTWSQAKYLDTRTVVQVGYYMRNLLAIHQLRTPAGISKLEIRTAEPWVMRARGLCERHYSSRPQLGTVRIVERLSSRDYDNLLASCVVFVELIDAVANNTVLECIARNTPIVVNRLPGTEHYLGRSYPLFYDDIGSATELLTDDNVMEAHEYLKRLPKKWLAASEFARSIAEAAVKHVPEVAGFEDVGPIRPPA